MQALFKKTFQKEYRKSSVAIQEAFNERLGLFLKDAHHPLLNTHKLKGEYEGCKSINVTGDIRAVYHIKNEKAIFIRIGTHTELYE